jgi:hypothetical protein
MKDSGEAGISDPDASFAIETSLDASFMDDSFTDESSAEASSTDDASADSTLLPVPSVNFSACPPSPAVGDFPLDVGAALHAKCQTCHRKPPVNHAPFPLLNYEDVLVAWKGAPRWQDMYRVIQPGSIPHMPFGNATPLTVAEFQTLSDWLATCAKPVDEGTGGDADSHRDAASITTPGDGGTD